ncbi:hypothetical protein C8F04DRAFT_1180726 [Mycena alexandri]|uniref:Uncharacterized protein n=1 Tax=Mycena alexandri TaxID=1745969 RepID=A0AAD6T0T8_9AGAR|nr:hypothetical protein C8F04DRAFT_1180726 [Mycena alexandri]
MTHQPTIAETRLKSISTCVAITANTLGVLVNTLKISALKGTLNTTESLLKMVETIKQEKKNCAELMEHVNKLLNAIVGVYLKSDTGVELPPNIVNQITKFTECFYISKLMTLHRIHTFVEAQQSSSKVRKFLKQGELNALLKDCKAGLQEGFVFFQADVLTDVREMQVQAELRHQEVLNIIEEMSSSDSASFTSDIHSDSSTSSSSISMLPAEPKIFYGRDSELTNILKLFSQGTPKIAILGAGGMGKTTLARIVLHHDTIVTKYHRNRFFIACDTVSNKVELAGLIGAHLGMKPGKDLTQAVLWHFSDALPSLLILDNLETSWEPIESRKDIEEFLSLLTDITSLALMVTMRGAERPAKVQWTQPFISPLQPLAQDAAQKMFIDIADDKHSIEEVDQVLHLTNNMPLSISLLAHLADMEGCSQILSRWETEKTALISEGHDKKSNLELSILLSLSSPRITSMPHSQDLLALLSILPDGLSDVELKQAKFPIKDIFSCKAALLRTALAYTDDHKRVKVLVPVREYMRKLSPPTDQMIKPLFKHFHELIKSYKTGFGKESGIFPIARITSNYTNIQNILRYNLWSEHPELANNIYCTCDFNHFSLRSGRGATPLLEDITSLLPSIDDHRLRVTFISELLSSLRDRPISDPEMLITQGLGHLEHVDDPEIESRFHSRLGFYYSEQNRDTPKAIKHCQTSLSLARASGDHRGQCVILERLSSIEWLHGNYLAGQAYAQELQKLSKISGDFFQEAVGLYNEVLCCKALGNYRYCIILSTRARTLLGLCGMSHAELDSLVLNSEANVHACKSEYVEAHNIENHILQEALKAHSLYQQGLSLLNIAEIEVNMGSHNNEIQRKIDASKVCFERHGIRRGLMAIECTQGDLNLREGDMSSSLFSEHLKSGWGDVMSYCLERLGNISRWEGSSHPSSWATVFLVHSLQGKQKLEIHKALQFLGDVFLKENDEVTATSLFTLALEGFTQMDVHRSRAECMIRLGNISKKNSDFLRAVELWETAKPLFKRSSQLKQIQDIDRRLDKMGEDMKKQHQRNIAQLTELHAPMSRVGEAKENSLEDQLDREKILV